ncbi:MAG: hypothetical protein HQK77_01700 [Desulfobacterales bacterium]|nr:hypothetical protein [Desulfobacterales bacterium]
MSGVIHQEWLDTIKAFQKLSPQERSLAMKKRLHQTLERMAAYHGITKKEAYELLLENKKKIRGF